VKEFTTAITGLPKCSFFMPLALQRLRAPAISRPVVEVSLLSVVIFNKKALSFPGRLCLYCLSLVIQTEQTLPGLTPPKGGR